MREPMPQPEGDPRRWIVAVDPARGGPDETVVGIGRMPTLERFITWRKASTMVTTGRIIELIRELSQPFCVQPGRPRFATEAPLQPPPSKVDRLIIDEPGIGGPIIDRLRELLLEQHHEETKVPGGLGFSEVEAFNGGAAAVGEKPERYLNRRAEAYARLGWLLEHDQADLPEDRLLREELALITARLSSNGRMVIKDKDELRSELGRSTDRADVASLFYCPRVIVPTPFVF